MFGGNLKRSNHELLLRLAANERDITSARAALTELENERADMRIELSSAKTPLLNFEWVTLHSKQRMRHDYTFTL